METTTDILSQVRSCINLQLAGAAVNQGGMLSIKQLFSNMKRFGDLDCDMTYSDFIEKLDSLRDEFSIREGEIGVDVNYISIKKD